MTEAKKAEKAEKKRVNINLEGVKGLLQVTSLKKSDKEVGTFVTLVTKDPTGKKTKSRSAVTIHATLQAAQAEVDKLIGAAQKAGFTVKAKKAKSGKPTIDALSLINGAK